MKKKKFDPQVLIPYSQLCELLDAAYELKQLRSEIKRMETNLSALRYQFIELMEKFKELD